MKNKTGNYFEINKDTPVVIYGAAAAGLRGYHSLKTMNQYNVVGFFDKRADEIVTQCGLPVWFPEAKLPYKKAGLLVIICVKNVFEHEKIANLLTKNGYKNLIFLPLQSLKYKVATDYAAINRNYQQIFNDADPEMQYELEPVPLLDDIEQYYYQDHAVLKMTEETVVVNFPLAAIFIQSTASFGMLHNEALLCNALALVPHIDLFRFFNGNDGDPTAYLEYCLVGASNSEMMYGRGQGKIAVTDGWRKNIIRNRRMVFDVMNSDIEINYNYFIDHAPVCLLQDDHYLLMKSAKHRAAYFITKGRTYMPVAISNKDYAKLLNMEVLNELKIFLQKNQIFELSATTQHPYMYNYPCRMWNYHELFVHKTIYHIARIFKGANNIAKIIVEDSLPDDGALSRCLARIGFHVNRICADDEDKALCMLLDRLFYITNTEYVTKFEGAAIVCCSGADLDRFTSFDNTRALFILSEDGKEPMVSGFEWKELLFRTIWNGNEVAGYMLENQQPKV
ncbi:MAG: hypothetical protein H8D45_10040 [Bacteroidetes bacterium]|nr:hypothetical protein [Bacteroidota bacterium]